MATPPQTVSGASAILHALEAAGITQLFVNLGSDHPAFLEAFASGAHPRLHVVTSPNEMNALSAASGFAQVTGRPAAVLVHVECGTQGLAGAVHNVSKGRIPVLILAGTVPATMEGELPGSRNEYIHWIQDVPDQRAIVRQYMKYEHEIRFPHNAAQIVLRALQFATSTPQGPVYLVASRETLEAETAHPGEVAKPSQAPDRNTAVEQVGLFPSAIEILSDALCQAERPLIVTSYTGRTPAGFEALSGLATLLSVAVHENAPVVNSFPTTSPLHQGHQWNGGGQLPALAEADVVLVVDSDVPWIPTQSRPRPDARIFHLDSDPLKTTTTLWSLPCERRWMCDSALALAQLKAHVEASADFAAAETRAAVAARLARLRARYGERAERLRRAEAVPDDGSVTVPYFVARLREATTGLRVLGLNESTTNLGNVADHLGHGSPLALIGSGGGSLGWWSGAAVGASLGLREDREGKGVGEGEVARGEALVVAFTGDGTWLFGVPASAYWMAQKYGCPFLTVVWNNGGWASPKNACLRIRPGVEDVAAAAAAAAPGGPSLAEAMGVSLSPSPDFGRIAQGAGGASSWTVSEAKDVDRTIADAIRTVREERRSALIEVKIKSL